MLYFFLPYTLFSYKLASVIHFLVLGITYWYSLKIIQDLLKKYIYITPLRNEQLLMVISFLCIAIHFSREMFLGNINIVMLLLSCLSLRDHLERKHFRGSLFLGLVILTKPYFLILVLPLLLRKQWKSLAGLVVTLFAGLLLPFLYPGPGKAVLLYQDWFHTMSTHDKGYYDMNSLDYLLRHYLFPSLPAYSGITILLFACVLLSWLILANVNREKAGVPGSGTVSRDKLFEWFIILAILPGLIKTDWVAYLLGTPLITFIIFYISSREKYRLIPFMVILLFFFSTNSDDLLGRELSMKLLVMGVMGMSNLFLVLLSYGIFRSETCKEKSIDNQ